MRPLKDILAERARAELDDRSLRSRTDARLERRHVEESLGALATELVELTDRQLGKLTLAEPLLDAVLEARAIRSPRARDRAIRVVRRELRAGDADAVAAQLHEPGFTRPRPRHR